MFYMNIDSQTLLLIIAAILVVWLTILTILYIRQQQFFSRLTIGLSQKDLKSLLEHIEHMLGKHQQELEHLQRTVTKDQEQGRKHLQKYALVRFNPFDETGGDQSFTLSLLNADDEGFVVTSLHSRDVTRVYAKNVGVNNDKQKKSELSKEEREALAQAIKR